MWLETFAGIAGTSGRLRRPSPCFRQSKANVYVIWISMVANKLICNYLLLISLYST
jgi:hypothetical protein